jgi:cytochrome c peroxidase
MNARVILGGLLIVALVACRKSEAPTSPTTLMSAGTANSLPQDAIYTFVSRNRQGSTIASTALAKPKQGTQEQRIAWDDEFALVADEDDRALLLLSVASGEAKSRVDLGARPGQLLVLSSGRVAVALRDKNEVVVYRLQDRLVFEEEVRVQTAREPIALAESKPYGTKATSDLFVAGGASHSVEQFELARADAVATRPVTLKKRVVFDVEQEPRAVIALEDGTVVVTHANAGVLTKIKGTEAKALRLDAGAMFSRQGFALTSLGKDAYVPDTFVLPEDISASMRGVAGGYGGGMACHQDSWHKGWMQDPRVAHTTKDAPVEMVNTGGFAHLDTKQAVPSFRSFDCIEVMSNAGTLRRVGPGLEPSAAATVTQLGTSCILPRSAAASEARREVYVACLGVDRIQAMNVGAADASPPTAPKLSRSWSVPKGPTGIAVHGDLALVWSQFAHQLTRIDLNAANESKGYGESANKKKKSEEAQSAGVSFNVLHVTELDAKVAVGRALFHAAGDTRIARDGRACASCHPDGLSDGIGWATPEGRRKPMVLAGRIGAGPFGWRGEHKTLRIHLTTTIGTNLHGTGLDSDGMDALESYLKAMPAPPEVKPEGQLATAYKRGQALFASSSTGCSGCHNPDANFTDNMKHEVGTGGHFRTPSLKFAGKAAPYMHEGKYAQLGDFLRATEGKMGYTKHLSDEDFNALLTYVQAL